MVFYAVVGWGAMIPFAIGNGAFREALLTPRLGDAKARAISSLMLSAFVFLGIAVLLWAVPGDESLRELLTVSLTWPALTILFEFGFGHYVERKPWDTLLADYNILKGRIWGLVLLSEFAAPLLVGSLL
jgi:hypothetical protein